VIGLTAGVMGLLVPAGNGAITAMVTRSYRGLERRAALTGQATVVTGSSTLGMLVGGPLIAGIGASHSIVLAGAVVSLTAAAAILGEYCLGGRGIRGGRGAEGKVRHDRERRPDRELSRL
jgi:MFS family permease